MVLTTSNTTNPPIPAGPYGLVEMSQNGSNVNVTIAMNSGFGVKLSGGDLFVNLTQGTTLTNFSVTNVMAGQSLGSLSSIGLNKLKVGGTLGSFTFSYDQQLKTNQTEATYVTFTLNNVQISQLAGFGIHLCVVAPNGNGCALTGFAVTGPVVPTEAPEPGTLGLLGTGLVGIGGLVRRRFRS